MNRGHTAKSQRVSKSTRFQPIHGLRKTPTGNSWSSMMSRCFNKKYNVFKWYGAKGITVCNFIQKSPQSLISIIGERPNRKTLDRIKSNLNYSCGSCKQCKTKGWQLNVRWATDEEQARNKSSNEVVIIDGVKKTISEWSDLSGLNRSTIYARVKSGKSGSDVIGAIKDKRKFLTIGGLELSLEDHAKRLGIGKNALSFRLARGWSEKELNMKKQKPRQVHVFLK